MRPRQIGRGGGIERSSWTPFVMQSHAKQRKCFRSTASCVERWQRTLRFQISNAFCAHKDFVERWDVERDAMAQAECQFILPLLIFWAPDTLPRLSPLNVCYFYDQSNADFPWARLSQTKNTNWIVKRNWQAIGRRCNVYIYLELRTAIICYPLLLLTNAWHRTKYRIVIDGAAIPTAILELMLAFLVDHGQNRNLINSIGLIISYISLKFLREK